MTITKRTGLGRPMTWSELDNNFSQVQESASASQQSAALAAASQASAATSEYNAAASAADAANTVLAAAQLRSDLSSTEDGKGLSLSVSVDGVTGQQFYDKADQFAGDYNTSVITITSVNRWITYNGERWYVKPGTSVPFTTSGLTSESWATDSVNFTSSSGGLASDLLSKSDGKGDALITVLQPFTGSVARTQHDKNTDVISVKDFGAQCDGITDDVGSIRSAVAYAESLNKKVEIVFPSGQYVTSGGVVLSGDNIKINASEALFTKSKTSDDNQTFFTIKGNYCSILGGHFDGGAFSGPGIIVYGSYNDIIGNTITGGVNLSAGILLDGGTSTCTDNVVRHNIIDGVSGVGVSQNSVLRSIISGNRIVNTGEEGITIDNNSHHCIVTGNTIRNCVTTGGVGAIGIDKVNHCTISNNFIFQTQSGVPAIKTQNNLGNSYYVNITGNVLETGSGYGVHLSKNGDYITSDCVISANIISDFTGAGVCIDESCTNNVLGDNRNSSGYTDSSYVSTIQSGAQGVCFHATNSTALTNITGDATAYTVVGLTSLYDKNANFNGSVFTAPRPGVYNLSFSVRGVSHVSNAGALRFITSSKKFEVPIPVVSDIFGGTASIDCLLNKDDTVQYVLYLSGGIGEKDANIVAGALHVTARLVG